MFSSKPQSYKAITYWITGQPGNCRYTVCHEDRLISSELFTTVVEANRAARQAIDLFTALSF